MSIKSKEYWKKRADKEEKKVYKDGDKLLKEFEKNLNKAKKEIQSGINDLIIKYMDRTELSYTEAMKYLTSSEFKEWRMTLEEYMKKIDRMSNLSPEIAKRLKLELETLATKSRISRLDTLNAQIDISLSKKSYEEQEGLKMTLGTVYKNSYKSLRLDFGVESSAAILDDKIIKNLIAYPWSGTNYSSRIWENRSALSKVLKQEIVQSFIQGISVKDLTNKMMGRLESDKKNTERLVRTELSYALNKATKLSYEDSEIEEYEYLAEIDSRTSQECKNLNGQVFKTEDAKAGVNYPPMHPHCRSTTIPVISYENFGKKKDRSKETEENKKEASKKIIKNSKKNDIIKEKEFIFKKANTIEEAEEYSRKVLGLSFIEYSKFHIDMANMINKELTEYYNVFGNLKEKGVLYNVEIYTKLPKDAVAAYASPYKLILMKNVKAKNTLDKMQKTAEKCFEAGFWSTKEKEHVIRHEAGHAIQHMILDKNLKKSKEIAFLRKTMAEKYGVYKREDWEKGRKDLKKMKDVGKEFSYYALYSDGEFVAESVAEYMAGNPRKIAKEVVKILLEGD